MSDAPLPAGIFRIEVPLPGSPLKSINAYVIPGAGRPLVIDTGMNRPECRKALLAGMAALDLRADRADFFITHFHMDHVGLVPVLAGPDAALYMGRTDAAAIDAMRDMERFRAALVKMAAPCGMPSEEINHVVFSHPGIKYRPSDYPQFRAMDDGDELRWGDFTFRCIETPGHTPGHMCLYEPRKKLFLSGDHVLGDITPNISASCDDGNPLAEYLASLDKVRTLDVNLVLPGHRAPFLNLARRIDELKVHHAQRAREALDVVAGRRMTAYEVAAHLTWDIPAKTWAEFPVLQKWFATGESAAHLKYLVGTGELTEEEEDGLVYYRRSA